MTAGAVDYAVIGTIVTVILGGIGKFVTVILNQFRNVADSSTKASTEVAINLAVLSEANRQGFQVMHDDVKGVSSAVRDAGERAAAALLKADLKVADALLNADQNRTRKVAEQKPSSRDEEGDK